MKPTYPGAGVHKVPSARARERRPHAAERVIAAMNGGATLHLHYEGGRALWRLSGGRVVPADTAAIVFTKTCVVPVGDMLFNDLPSQTWRPTDD